MMRALFISWCYLFAALYSFGQTNENITYFNMSVLNESNELPSGIYVSAVYKLMDKLPIKSYKGSDPAILRLAEVVNYATDNNKNSYVRVSKKNDTTVENSLMFYNLFMSHSPDPKLYATATIGRYMLLYVEVHEKSNLVVFAFEKNQGTYLNYPFFSEHPAVTALSDAVIKTYMRPDLFSAEKSIPGKNTVISFDSSMQQANTGFAFYLDIDSVKFDAHDQNDTANQYDKKYKPVLSHYRNTLKALQDENISKYYMAFTEQSKARIVQSFRMSGGAKGDALKYYKRDKTGYSNVSSIVDMGNTKLLLTTNTAYKTGMRRRVYIATVENELKWVNEHMEFYMDELFRTPEFVKAFSLNQK
jgi:hypothetical protein